MAGWGQSPPRVIEAWLESRRTSFYCSGWGRGGGKDRKGGAALEEGGKPELEVSWKQSIVFPEGESSASLASVGEGNERYLFWGPFTEIFDY